MAKNTNILGINTNYDGSPLLIGVGAFTIGTLANTFLHGNTNIVYGCYAMGVISIFNYMRDLSNNWDKIFTACGLSVKTGDVIKVPKSQQRTKTNNGFDKI
jgi:hypothetical protein